MKKTGAQYFIGNFKELPKKYQALLIIEVVVFQVILIGGILVLAL